MAHQELPQKQSEKIPQPVLLSAAYLYAGPFGGRLALAFFFTVLFSFPLPHTFHSSCTHSLVLSLHYQPRDMENCLLGVFG